MNPNTTRARAMSDGALALAERELARLIPGQQAFLAAIRRERKRRRKQADKVSSEVPAK